MPHWLPSFFIKLPEPKKLCDFKPIHGKILKTVDSVYQNVTSVEECQQRCLQDMYRCRSYDFGDPVNPVCRTSHLDKVSLAHIDIPYIEIAGSTTYELVACYDGLFLIFSFLFSSFLIILYLLLLIFFNSKYSM